MPIGGVEQKIIAGQTSELIDSETKAILKSSTFNIINLECPLTTAEGKILKTGKNFKANPKCIDFLKEYNFKVACMANNHIMDYQIPGLMETLETCDDNEIKTIGISQNGHDKIFRYEEKGISISIINASETEFGSASVDTTGFMRATPQQLFYWIQNEKMKSKWVILIIHGGREFYNLPSPSRQKEYKLYADFGADAIISHHTHVPSGFEWYNGKPIIYSLGNFIFPFEDHVNLSWYDSLICQLEFFENNIELKFSLHKFNQNDLQLQGVSLELKTSFMEYMDDLNIVIKNSVLLDLKWKEFVYKERFNYFSMLNLFSQFRHKLFLKGIISEPKIKASKLLVLLNILRCEAHHEESVTALKIELEKHNNFIN
ncbi:MAG: CapA family protein [Parachlamydiaceae bacterium]|nr:CapA family protein [Parachlamydiaceae bacterium]